MQKITLMTLSIAAAVAITAERFMTASGTYPTARQGALGVAATDGAIGDLVPVDVIGAPVITAGAAFAKDTPLAAGANGKAVAAEAGDVIVAIALEAATADGDRVQVFFIPNATPASGS